MDNESSFCGAQENIDRATILLCLLCLRNQSEFPYVWSFLSTGRSVNGQIWPCLFPCCLCASEVSKSCWSAGIVTVINSLSREFISLSSPLRPNSVEEQNHSLRYCICECVVAKWCIIHKGMRAKTLIGTWWPVAVYSSLFKVVVFV